MAITIVQTKGTAPTNATSISTTITAPASTSQLVAVGYTDALNANISISALTSQVWSKVLGVDGGGNQHDLFAWISTNPGTGTTVTVNNGSALTAALVVIELAGTSNVSTADGSSTSAVAPATTTTFACASQTPAVANDVDISWFCDLNDGGAIVGTQPSGYTIDTNGTQSTAGQRLIVARKIKTDSAAEAPTWTTTTTTTHGFAGQILVKPSSTSFLPDHLHVALQAVNRGASY